MTMTTITSKGQLTVPKPVRDALRLKPGDRVEVSLTSDGAMAILRPKRVRLLDLYGCFPPPERSLNLDEMDRAIAAGAMETME